MNYPSVKKLNSGYIEIAFDQETVYRVTVEQARELFGLLSGVLDE